jgi:FkbM family methyltransferase
MSSQVAGAEPPSIDHSVAVCKLVFRSMCRFLLQTSVRTIVRFEKTRGWLNTCYRRLSWPQKQAFHRRCSQVFRGGKGNKFPSRGWSIESGTWESEFVGRRIKMPIRSDKIWLDWGSALAVAGHDIEVKQTYSELIESGNEPDLFVDIGANYGTHSLIFLVHNIRTITFEPNTSCHREFRIYCELNRVQPRVEPVALGEHEDVVELWYPEHSSWLGSTNKDAQSELRVIAKNVCQKVRQKRLDDYLCEFGGGRILIKIDTEGGELSILRGGQRTLAEKHPLVIFEVWRAPDERRALWDLLWQLEYKIAGLPWTEARVAEALACAEFVEAPATNFIALPASGLWKDRRS